MPWTFLEAQTHILFLSKKCQTTTMELGRLRAIPVTVGDTLAEVGS